MRSPLATYCDISTIQFWFLAVQLILVGREPRNFSDRLKLYNYELTLYLIYFILLSSHFHFGKAQTYNRLFNGKDLSGWTMDVPAHDKKPELTKPFISS